MNDLNKLKLIEEAFKEYMNLFVTSSASLEKIEALRHAFKIGFMTGRKSIKDSVI